MTCLRRFVVGIVLATAGVACSKPSASLCTVTERACQESIYQHVLSLRGDGFDPFNGLPPVTVITEDEFRQQLIDRDNAITASRGRPNPWDKAKLLLHLTTNSSTANPDGGVDGGGLDGGGVDGGAINSTIEDEAKHVYAYYVPETKTVTIVSHSEETTAKDPGTPVISLAHELVHSLQNRELDLRTQDFNDTDEFLAYETIIEGDARFYQYLFMNDVLHLGYDQPHVALIPKQELDYYFTHFSEEAGAPFFAAKLFTYALGAAYEAAEYQAGGNAAVRHGYAHAPRRTIGYLIGSDGVAPPVGPAQPCAAPWVADSPLSGPNSFKQYDQLGALQFYTFLRGWNVEHDVAWSTARSWTGDYLRVQASADLTTTTAVAWRIEFSAPPPASVAQKLGATGELSVTTRSNILEITVSDSATPLTWKSAPNCP